jgi:folate-binding protein YgfZ
LTNDVLALGSGQGQLSAKLTPRGHLVGYFSLHRLPNLGQPFPTFFLLTHREVLGSLLADLSATVLNEDLVIEDVTAQFEAVVLQGPKIDEVLDNVLGHHGNREVPENSIWVPALDKAGDNPAGIPADLMVMARSFTGDPGRLLLWNADPAGTGFTETLLTASREQGLVVLDGSSSAKAAWDWLTLEAGWPRLGLDLEPGKTLLPETGLEHQVVGFAKGCYPGQEVVARIRTYGSVPKALRGLAFPEGSESMVPQLPGPGSSLEKDGKKIGTWGSSAWSVTRDGLIAHAFLDRQHRVPGTRLTVATGAGPREAEVVLLPFFRGVGQGDKARLLHDQALRAFGEGQDDRAAELLEQAVRHDPGYTDAYEALGVILGRGGKYLQAIDIFRRLEEVAPAEPMVNTNLSLYYQKIGDKEEAERQKAQATLKRFTGTTDPAEAEALAREAEAAGRREARRQIDLLGEVLELDPRDGLALFGLGKAHALLGEYGRADTYLARALEATPDNSALYAARGKVLEALGRFAEAGDTYRQGVNVASRRGHLMPLQDMEHRLLLLEAGRDRIG